MRSTTLTSLLTFASLALAQDHGEEASREMGPVAFMWPPDRVWGAAQDNNAPCGSSAGVVNRTNFPLVNGQVALVMRDEAWHVMVSVSYDDNPTSNDDFELLIDSHYIPDLDPGHECYPLPANTSTNVQAGRNATLQLVYIADNDDSGQSTGNNETFYACADVTFVEPEEFKYQVPCFNASTPEFPLPDEGGSNTDSDSAQASSTPTASSSGGGGLSGGAIAGIVVGVVGGLALIGAGLFFIWRLRNQRERLRAQNESVRAVKWDGIERPSTTPSDNDVELRDVPPQRS